MRLSRKRAIAACFCAFISLPIAQAPQAFDVSSVKENKSGSEEFSIPTNTHGTFVGKNMTLMLLITTAYRVQNVQVIGGPSWINTARFDIDAKGPDTAATAPEVYAMVRTLLANRFKLVIRNETRELPVYALVVAKGGPKFKTAEEGSCKEAVKAGQPCPTNFAMFKNGMAIIGGTTQAAATILGRVLEDRYVIDKTGLTGRYDISFMWKFDDPGPRNPSGREEPSNLGYEPPKSAFVALEEQAGLRLEPTKDKVPVLIIESVQMPEPN